MTNDQRRKTVLLLMHHGNRHYVTRCYHLPERAGVYWRESSARAEVDLFTGRVTGYWLEVPGCRDGVIVVDRPEDYLEQIDQRIETIYREGR